MWRQIITSIFCSHQKPAVKLRPRTAGAAAAAAADKNLNLINNNKSESGEAADTKEKASKRRSYHPQDFLSKVDMRNLLVFTLHSTTLDTRKCTFQLSWNMYYIAVTALMATVSRFWRVRQTRLPSDNWRGHRGSRRWVINVSICIFWL